MYRKPIRAVISMLIVCAMLIVPAFAESATITGSKVNVRSGPGTEYYAISALERGTVVEVTDRTSYGSWYQISYNGMIGFISSAYLSLSSSGSSGITVLPSPSTQTGTTGTAAANSSGSAASSSGSTVSGKTFYINAMYVRFRSGPGSTYSVVGEYNKGKEITVVTTVGDWVAGYIDGNPGYVHKSYVSSSYVASAAASTASQSGITVVTPTPQATSALPQPNESITVITVTPTPTPTPVQTASPIPTSSISVLPSPNVNIVVSATPTPTASASQTSAATPSNSASVNANGVKAYIVGTYVRFRTGPGTNYSIIGTYNSGKEIIAYANSGNGWLFCSVDGTEGYVHGDYVYVSANSSGASNSSQTGSTSQNTAANTTTSTQNVNVVVAATAQPVSSTGNKTGYIVGNNVRFRAAASMTSQILGELFYGNQVTITGTTGEWSQIVYGDKVGYVYSTYVREGTYGAYGGTDSTSTSASTASANPSNVTGQDIVNFAGRYLGYKYCWGGTSPETGFDCSGFVYFVFKHFGFNINRVASDQASNGVHVDPANLKPGDILCFYSGSSYIGHAGIYIGNNKFIHASNSTTGVIISDLSGYYATRGFEARRLTTA